MLGTVLLASGGVVGVSVLMSLFYFAFPQIVLSVFFPKPGYQVLTQYLGYYSLYILIFAFASLLNSYFLSIGKTRVYIITLIGAVIQIEVSCSFILQSTRSLSGYSARLSSCYYCS